jgi:hypothetical protein
LAGPDWEPAPEFRYCLSRSRKHITRRNKFSKSCGEENTPMDGFRRHINNPVVYHAINKAASKIGVRNNIWAEKFVENRKSDPPFARLPRAGKNRPFAAQGKRKGSHLSSAPCARSTRGRVRQLRKRQTQDPRSKGGRGRPILVSRISFGPPGKGKWVFERKSAAKGFV